MFEKTVLSFVNSFQEGDDPVIKVEATGLSQESIDEIVACIQKCNERDNLQIHCCKSETEDMSSFI